MYLPEEKVLGIEESHSYYKYLSLFVQSSCGSDPRSDFCLDEGITGGVAHYFQIFEM